MSLKPLIEPWPISNEDMWQVIKAKADITIRIHFACKNLDKILTRMGK